MLAVAACVEVACTTASDRLQAAEASSSLCATDGVNLSSVTTEAPTTTPKAAVYAVANDGPNASSSYNAYMPPVATAYSGAIKSTSNTGAIVGGVVGGIGGLFLVALTIYLLFWLRGRIQRSLYGPPQDGIEGGMVVGEEVKTPYSETSGVEADASVYQQQQQQYQQAMDPQNLYPPQSSLTTTPAGPPSAAFTTSSSAPNMPTPYPSYPPPTGPVPPPPGFPVPSSGISMPTPFPQPTLPPSPLNHGLSTEHLEMVRVMQRLENMDPTTDT
ncbi:hypothetical protein FRB97_008814 [Tulasnella sp. 331]|nr:hypothetical protein FRB97_008814 [Tulasnella sp. 331]